MENKNFEKFIEEAKKINLSTEERSSVEKSVLNFIKDNPIVNSNQLPRLVHQDGANASLWSRIFLTKLNFAPTMAMALVIAILFGGGVSLGAEKALPGDTLYPVKVGINEEVRSWIAISEESKADWEVKRVERRLEEAEELATKGTFNDGARANLEAQFEAHAEKVKNRIEKLETKKNFNAAVDVSSKFEKSLKEHEKRLNKLKIETESKNSELESIKVKIRSRADKTKKNRERVESREDSRKVERDTDDNEDNDKKEDDNNDNNDDDDDDDDENTEIKSQSNLNPGRDSIGGEVKIEVNTGL